MDVGDQLPTSAAISSWFALAVQKTRNMVTVTDREDRVVWVNEAFERGTGYSLAEVRGRRPAEFLQGNATDLRMHQQVELAVRERKEFEGEIGNYRRDGRLYWVWLSITPLFDEAGAHEGFITIQTDITKRKELESELAKFRLAIQKSEALVMLTDRADCIEWVNERFIDETGYTIEEVRGRRPADVLRGPDTDPDVAREVDESADEHSSFEGEIYNYRKDGTGYWVSVSTTPIYDGEGVFQGYIGICVDTTERRLLEAEMARFKDAEIARLELAMRQSRSSVMITDPEDRIEWVNEGFTRLSGYPLEEVRGRFPKDFLPGAATDPETLRQLAGAVRGRRSFEGEIYNYRRDGSGYWAWISLTPLHSDGPDGERFRGFISIHVDVTDRKQLESELAQTIEQLRVSQRAALESERRAMEASRAKSAFLANMSHELRTPLNAILGFVQLLERDDALTKEHRETLTIITRSGEHLLALINDILSISKIETGKLTLNEQPFDLGRLLRDIEEMVRNRANAKRLQFVSEVDSGFPRFVRGDEGKLRQVLINLLSNAVKFTETGGVALRVRWNVARGSAASGPGRVMFEVEDTGFGIAPDDLGTLFEAFTQTESGKRVHEGTGLGLAISQHFVRMMGSEIRVKSRLGEGSLFSFEVDLPEAAAREDDAAPRRVKGLEPGQPEVRILIVDDVWENRAFLAKLLQSVGFDVREAVNGAEAFETWEAWRPHLIWMDMRMPIVDGYEATRRIRAAEILESGEWRRSGELGVGSGEESGSNSVGSALATPHSSLPTRIIALTASAFEHDRETILDAGCDDFVAKPFRESALFAKIEEHLGVRFLYENIACSTGASSRDTMLTPARLSSLPHSLVAELGEVALLGDMAAAHDVIDRIQLYDQTLAAELRQLIKSYRFEEIQALIV
jgi:PAS domain S-box-containing protein